MNPLTTALDLYFRAERDLGVALAIVGLGCLAGAAWVWRTQTGGFAWGLLLPLGLVGLAFAGGGGFLAQRSAAQQVDLAAQLQSAPQAYFAAEVPRMEKVMQLWPRAKAVWTVAIISALVLLMVVKRDWAHGLGLGLLLLATVLFFVDVFGERRAAVYSDAIAAAQRAP